MACICYDINYCTYDFPYLMYTSNKGIARLCISTRLSETKFLLKRALPNTHDQTQILNSDLLNKFQNKIYLLSNSYQL